MGSGDLALAHPRQPRRRVVGTRRDQTQDHDRRRGESNRKIVSGDFPYAAAMTQRASLAVVTAWIEAAAGTLDAEPVARAEAAGRVAAADNVARAPLPACDGAAIDGVALRAAETVGASAYNPLSFRLVEGEPLPPGAAQRVAAGDPLPAGSDTVVAFDQ